MYAWIIEYEFAGEVRLVYKESSHDNSHNLIDSLHPAMRCRAVTATLVGAIL
jgi:hypothetical protein